jgi:hypothetical protein
LYGFQFDKQQEENIINVDQNIDVLKESVKTLDNNIKVLELDTVKTSQLSKNLTSDTITTKKLVLANKWSLSGAGDSYANDEWLRLLSKDGKNYFGGFASAKLWVKDSVQVLGDLEVKGNASAAKLTVKGAKSTKNPLQFNTILNNDDGKNYIRGDTEVKGNINVNAFLSMSSEESIYIRLWRCLFVIWTPPSKMLMCVRATNLTCSKRCWVQRQFVTLMMVFRKR